MKLYANAALSLKKREWLGGGFLSRLVAGRGGRGRRVSVRSAGKWLGRFLAEGEAGLGDRSSAPRRVANATPEDRVQVIAAFRRLGSPAPRSRTAGDAGDHGLGDPDPDRLGRLGGTGSSPPPLRALMPRRVLVHIDVKKLGRIEGGAGHRIHGKQGLVSARNLRRNGSKRRHPRLGIRPRRDRRRGLASPTPRCWATRGPQAQTAFLGRAIEFFARHGIQVKARDDRQRLGLPLERCTPFACRALGVRHLTHPPLSAADQRQS